MTATKHLTGHHAIARRGTATTELVVVIVVICIGLVSCLVSIRDAGVSELSDIGGSVEVSNQSFTISGSSTASATTAGMGYADETDELEASIAFETLPTDEEPRVGDGLLGEYFTNTSLSGVPITRVDPTVNFNWGSGSPSSEIGNDNFSVRWSGQIEPLYSETYTFSTRSDDGVRLYVNGQLLIDQWRPFAPTVFSGSITLQGGVRYDIRLEYFERGGGAVAQLRWQSPSQPFEVIPTSQLFSAEP